MAGPGRRRERSLPPRPPPARTCRRGAGASAAEGPGRRQTLIPTCPGRPLPPPGCGAGARGHPGAGRVAATCLLPPPAPRSPGPGPRARPPAPPLPEPEMCTRRGRPLLDHDDRSLCERPRGLGSPGSLRGPGGGADAWGSGAPAASCAGGSPGGSGGLLPASAIGSGGAGSRLRAPGRAPGTRRDPEAARGAGRLDAGRRDTGGDGGRAGGGGGRGQKSLHRKEPPTACARSRGPKPLGSEPVRPPRPRTCRLPLPQGPGAALCWVAAAGSPPPPTQALPFAGWQQ